MKHRDQNWAPLDTALAQHHNLLIILRLWHLSAWENGAVLWGLSQIDHNRIPCAQSAEVLLT